MNARLEEHFISRECILEGDFLQALRDTVTLPDGSTAFREYIVHPGAVMVIPLLDDGRLVMERQYRYPVQRVMLEFPAGKLDSEEAPLHCAQRELQEETGYRALEWARAGKLHPVIGYSTECIEIWFARGLSPGPQKLDKGEFVDVTLVHVDALISGCLDGSVTDAKTVAGAMWLQGFLSGRCTLHWQGFHSQVQTRTEVRC
jgi:ADP-ribose pyrophosphatase